MPYQNPVIRGMNPDPTICRAGDDYYLATSTMYMYPGVPIYHSRDLVNWKMIGHCLTRPEHFQPEKTNGIPMIYAPTLRYHDGTFYMVTTNVHGGGNFYVTATDPAGPWSDPIVIDQDVFDPSLMFDDDGKVYYTRRGLMHNKDVVQAEIDIKTGKLLTELRSIGVGMVSDDAEGPHLYHIDDWYYLLQAEGGSRFLHMASIGRSKSPWGPFEPCPHNPILAQHEAWWHPVRSIGHPDFVQAADGSWWVVFLGTRHASYDALTILGRETFLARVEWVDGWPTIDRQAMRELSVDADTLPLQPWPEQPARDKFESLSPEWTYLTVPTPGIVDVAARKGFLRLWGQPSLLLEGAPTAFLGIRIKDLKFVSETVVDFTPISENEEAGITIFQRHDFHYDLAVTRRGGDRVIVLRKMVGDIVVEAASLQAPGGPVRLRVTGNDRHYVFAFLNDAGEWVDVGSAMTQLIAAEVAQTWAGVFVGLYSSGNGKLCETPADFDWFEYRSDER